MAGAQQLIYPTVCRHNPLNIFAAHEITGFADPSVATKMTVHFNLFGGMLLPSSHLEHPYSGALQVLKTLRLLGLCLSYLISPCFCTML